MPWRPAPRADPRPKGDGQVTDTERFDWLKRLLRKVETTHPKYAYLSSPLVVTIGGEAWTVVTNNVGVLYLAGATPDVPVADPEAAAVLAKHFEPEPREHLAVVSLDALKTWCEPPVWTEPCPACKGTSADSEYVTCTFCDDGGSLKAPQRFGCLCGATVDRELLAEYLYGDGGGEVAVHWSGKAHSPLWVVTFSWRVAVMPVLPGTGELGALPSFPATAPRTDAR